MFSWHTENAPRRQLRSIPHNCRVVDSSVWCEVQDEFSGLFLFNGMHAITILGQVRANHYALLHRVDDMTYIHLMNSACNTLKNCW